MNFKRSGMFILLAAGIFFMFLVRNACAVSVVIDGEKLKLDTPPLSKNNMVFVPLRGIFEKLGATVQYNKDKNLVTAYRRDRSIQVTPGNPVAKVNGSQTRMVQPAFTYEGRMYVPLRFISEALGCRVGWHPPTATVAISTKANVDPLDELDSEDAPAKSENTDMRKAIIRTLLNPGGSSEDESKKDPSGSSKKIERIKPGVEGIKPIEK